MTSRYVVFQYVPDPLTDERINFGVATHGDEGFYARFLHDWRRVRSFAGASDVRFLSDFARSVIESSDDYPSLFADTDEAVALFLDRAPSTWINSIQVTQPRGSTKPSDKLIDDTARRFLRTSARRRRGRDRRWIRRETRELLLDALQVAGADDAQHLLRKVTVEGNIESHDFDVTVGNGRVVTAALALSFERQSAQTLQRDYASAAWAIEDVRNRDPELPLAVVMLPPVSSSKIYDQARYVFEKLEARAVPEDDIPEWAAEVAESVVAA